MKLAVTAASGQLGAAIVKEAITQLGRQNVVGIGRNPEKAAHLGLEIRKGDYNKREEYGHALEGIEVVLLVSAMVPLRLIPITAWLPEGSIFQ